MTQTSQPLTRQRISDAVGALGWRLILGAIHTSVRAGSLAAAVDLLRRVIAGVGDGDRGRLRADVRDDRLLLTLQDPALGWVAARDLDLATAITATARDQGYELEPDARQAVEIAIDAIDIPAVRPFWKAVLGYVDEPGAGGAAGGLVDPAREGPAFWFQQMDAPRPQRNRIHIDVSVAHDEVERRLTAALAAGGRLVTDAYAPSFWVLADAEGNEACICSWQGRD